MERQAEWEVGGFQFGSEKDVELAKQEQEKIEYLEKRMHYDQPQTVLTVYNMAVDNRTFQTPIGLRYLQKLHDFLMEQEIEGELRSIPLYQVYSYDPTEQVKPRIAQRRIQPSRYKQLRSSLRKSIILNIFLIVLVAAMFVITMTADQPNILNFERALVNKYAGWEQELAEREAALRERESSLEAQIEE